MGKRADQKAATRRLLKDVALKLFAEQSTDKVRPADVTRAAGLAQGTFYVHFANHAELVDELVVDLNNALNAALLQAIAATLPSTLREAARVAARAMLDHYKLRIGLFGLFADRFARLGPHALVEANRAVVEAITSAGQRYSRELTRLQATLLAHSIAATWRQAVLLGLSRGEAQEDIIEAMVQLTEAMVESMIPGVFDLDPALLLAEMHKEMTQ